MTEPTKEMIEAWASEWAETPDPRAISGDVAPMLESLAEFIARRAAAWAREQERERIRDELQPILDQARGDLAQGWFQSLASAIRALKGKS